MPELPEVETVRRGLFPTIYGAKILDIALGAKGLRFPFPANLAQNLIGKQYQDLERRGKYLLFYLQTGHILLSHLGMSGSWRVVSAGQKDVFSAKKSMHDHFVMHVSLAQGGEARLIYNDPRRFGFVDFFAKDNIATHARLCHLGIEPLSADFNDVYLKNAFLYKKSSLKTILLDQNIIAGLGNIYVCEALFQVGLSPFRLACELAEENEWAHNRRVRLVEAIQAILQKAIAAGGSSLKDHVQADGSLGYFQNQFLVYGRENEPCSRCEAKILRTQQVGRSTFYCQFCQI